MSEEKQVIYDSSKRLEACVNYMAADSGYTSKEQIPEDWFEKGYTKTMFRDRYIFGDQYSPHFNHKEYVVCPVKATEYNDYGNVADAFNSPFPNDYQMLTFGVQDENHKEIPLDTKDAKDDLLKKAIALASKLNEATLGHYLYPALQKEYEERKKTVTFIQGNAEAIQYGLQAGQVELDKNPRLAFCYHEWELNQNSSSPIYSFRNGEIAKRMVGDGIPLDEVAKTIQEISPYAVKLTPYPCPASWDDLDGLCYPHEGERAARQGAKEYAIDKCFGEDFLGKEKKLDEDTIQALHWAMTTDDMDKLRDNFIKNECHSLDHSLCKNLYHKLRHRKAFKEAMQKNETASR